MVELLLSVTLLVNLAAWILTNVGGVYLLADVITNGFKHYVGVVGVQLSKFATLDEMCNYG